MAHEGAKEEVKGDWLAGLKGLDGPTAVFLYGGIGVFAAAASAYFYLKMFPDLPTAFWVAVVVVVAAVGVRVLVHLAQSSLVLNVLTWVIVICIVGAIAGAACSVLFPRWIVPPVKCWFAESPRDCQLNLLAKSAPAPETPAEMVEAPTAAAVVPSDHTVHVQFGGLIDRDDVRAMMQTLADQTWKVEGVKGGGERTPNAAGVNEVRYPPGAEDAARALALAVQAVNVSGQAIRVVEVSSIPEGKLEVWISR